MYLDSAYVAKYYMNEPDSPSVRSVIQGAEAVVTSAFSVADVTCALHRHLREHDYDLRHFRGLIRGFREHIEIGFWTLVPVTDTVLRRLQLSMETLPAGLFLRAGDAVQLVSAVEAGEHEIWTSDRHLLAAAPHFGLAGRSA